jgi:hypothetical protein
MTDAMAESLLAKGVDPKQLMSDGYLTRPRSWGVYEIFPEPPAATRRFREGNHPVRMKELEKEFGRVRLVRVFLTKDAARELANYLNAILLCRASGGG